ncbi:MAG: hypothetical protein GEEBNDBF_02150 [bacterium]|nr:hypothetical protein [bacterium]
MKVLLTTSMLALLTFGMLSPSQAAAYIKFDGVDGECSATADAMLDLREKQPEPVGLLLPAVQKVREAAARMTEACGQRDGSIDADCAAKTLAAAIGESKMGRDKSPGLTNLVAKATGGQIKEVPGLLRSWSQMGATGTEQQIIAILIGLLQETRSQGITEPDVLDPLVAAIVKAEEIDPETQSAKIPKGPGYDIKLAKKV